MLNLDAYERIGAPEEVLKWIKYGVKLPFRTIPGHYRFPNRLNSDRQRLFVKEKIQELLSSGAIRKLPPGQKPRCINAISTAPKKNGKLRFILDTRAANAHIVTPKFSQEGINVVCDLIQEDDELITVDLRDGFHHVAVHKDYQTYLGMYYDGAYYVWCCLPFGLSCSPYYFNKVLRPVVRFLRENGLRNALFVDDFCLMAKPCLMTDHKEFMLTSLEDLGWLVNFEKSVLIPKDNCVFVGFRVYSRGPNGPYIKVLPEKLHKLKRSIRRCLNKSTVTARELARIAGQCVFISRAVLPGKLLLRNIYRVLSTRTSWDSIVQLTESALADLEWWSGALRTWNGAPCCKPPVDVQIITDSSGFGYGAICGDLEVSGLWDYTDSQEHINFKELKAILVAIQSFKEVLTGKCVQVLTDNICSVAYINHLGGPKERLSNLMEDIWALAHKYQITLSARHLAGHLNPSDRLSRLTNGYEWKLNPALFKYLDRLYGHHTIDRFASALTKQCPLYNSRYYDPGTAGVDALAQQDWGDHNNFVNPPFRMVSRVLDVIQNQGAIATIIAPKWPAQHWFSRLQRMCISPPIKLPNNQHTVIRVGALPEPLKNRNWELYAWRVSGAID